MKSNLIANIAKEDFLNFGLILEQREYLQELRRQFVGYFTFDRISKMKIGDYVLGLDQKQDIHNFCYALEQMLKGLGRIFGGTSFKFGIYYGKTKSDPTRRYRFTSRFGNDERAAFNSVREAILQLLDAGKSEDLNAIETNLLSPMFKGKILSTYFPEKFLPIFTDHHVNHFITALNLDLKFPKLMQEGLYSRKQALVEFKNDDSVMAGWSMDIFYYFLYNVFPGGPFDDSVARKRKNLSTDLPPMAPNPQPIEVALTMLPMDTGERSRTGNAGRVGKPNYEGQQKKLKIIGNRGEGIALSFERARLAALGYKGDLSKIKPAEDDSDGYDILSTELDGKARYIEVKTTLARPGPASFFLSANELAKAEKLPNYHLYFVFEAFSRQPKVWMLGNPLYPKNPLLKLTPVLYKGDFNVE